VKRYFKVFISVALLSAASGGTVNAAISGSKHDLTSNATKSGDQSLCTYCHGAHGSEEVAMPLWSRSTSKEEFTLYSSTTMNATATLTGTSAGCLSCHDGVTAFDAINGSTGAAEGNNMNANYAGSSAILGDNLSNDHPVGVLVSADADGIEDESTITAGPLNLYGGKVECASCHDAHGKGGYDFFLRVNPADGSLCTLCHTK
jgi:hypothetical protein